MPIKIVLRCASATLSTAFTKIAKNESVTSVTTTPIVSVFCIARALAFAFG